MYFWVDAVDQFGNYFVQNLYIVSSEAQSLLILNQLRTELVSIAFGLCSLLFLIL